VDPQNNQNTDGEFAMMGPMAESAPHASPFKIKRILVFLLKYWWIPVLTLLFGIGAGVAFALSRPPTFVSVARMWETVKLRLPDGAMFTEDIQNFVGTQTELLQSEPLREQALARLRSSAPGNKDVIPLGNDGQPLPVAIRVSGGVKSSVFTLDARCSDAGFCPAYLDALMDAYLEYKRNVRREVSQYTLASITEQVQKWESDLKFAQDVLMDFQRTNNMAILQEEGTIAGGYLARLKTQLSDLQLDNELLKATSIEKAGQAATNDLLDPLDSGTGAGSGSPSAAGSPRQTAFNDLEMLKIQRDRLGKYLLPKHPKMVKLNEEIERSEKLLEVYRQQSRDQLAASRQANELRENNVRDLIKKWEAKVVEANALISEAERLKLNVQRIQSVYDRLELMVQNVGISRNIDQETLAILEPASRARRSYTEEKSLLTSSAMGGLGLGLAIIAFIMIRDDRFTSLQELNESLGENIVGQVPKVLNLEEGAALPLLEIDDQRHAFAESYRSLRSAVIFMSAEATRPKVLLVTSALPNEGKSTIAANLARMLALGGSRVVLVDCDLRKGVLHRVMGLNREPGLAEALRTPVDLAQVLQTNSLPNLAFIASGRLTANSGDIFLGGPFDHLLARLREEFDYVLIDGSPIFASDDATTLAPKVDATLFVVRNRFSRAGLVREALNLLRQRNATVLGVIFNQADATANSYHYYKYAQYYPATQTPEATENLKTGVIR
jgi:polysaccharide biosynthesis transport protein